MLLRLANVQSHLDQNFFVHEITDLQDLLALKDDWSEVWNESTQQSVFASWDWAVSWWLHFGDSVPTSGPLRTMRILAVYSELSQLCGLLPLYGVDKLSAKCWSREIRQFGDDGRDGERMTEEPTIVIRRGCEDAVLDAALHYLFGAQSSSWDFMKLRVQTERTPLDQLPASSKRHKVKRRIAEGSQILNLPSDWETYRKTLSRSMRDNLKYYPRKLDRAQVSWRTHWAERPDEVRDYFPDLVRLHNHRALNQRGKHHGTHLRGDRHVTFLRDIMRRLAEQQRVTLGVMEANGEIIAAQAFLHSGDAVVVYYSGYSADWFDYSPVFILGSELIRRAQTQGIRKINFLPDQRPWKERWGATSSTAIHELAAISMQPASLARIAYRSAQRTIERGLSLQNGVRL